MAAASASLALAACGGGGDSTMQTQQPEQAAPVPPVAPPSKSVVPMPFASLRSFEKGLAVAAIKNAHFGIVNVPIQLRGRRNDNTWMDKGALQITAWKDKPLGTPEGPADSINRRVYKRGEGNGGQWTKLVKVTPMSTTEHIDYRIEFWLSGSLWGNSIYQVAHPGKLLKDYLVAKTTPLVDEPLSWLGAEYDAVRFLTVQGDNWKSSKKLDLGFDESYKYNVMKNYQVMTADFDIDKDKTSNASTLSRNVWDSPFYTGPTKIAHLLKPRTATLHSEIWTDYSSDNTNDYMVGGVWLLVPTDIRDIEAYDFGGFVRGEKPLKRNAIGEIEGSATYKGSAAGLHTSWDNNMVKISRLLGKVTLTANFLDGTKHGTVDGSVYDLMLDGKEVSGSFTLSRDMDLANYRVKNPYNKEVNIGNINGINYTGAWYAVFQIPGATDAAIPGGVVGTIGGTGTNGNTVVATFGAYKVESEE